MGKKVKDQVFAFDRIFDENSTQADVYEGTTRNLLDSVLDGYNATVFAYGATGCGKTHTITGTAAQPGIIFLTMQELFEKIADRSRDKVTELRLSYLEIYNETIRDLLVPGGSKQGLMLREDSHQAVTVAGLSSHHPKDVQEVMDMIVQGNEYRTVSPTAANAVSSRSHAVLQINVAQRDRDGDVHESHTMSTLSIIDLAGSERASATKNRGERLLEGANINKSLLALGSCINALCDGRKKNHVPYRNSKLTRLLKFSLGGNCKTVMIVCVSPSSEHFDETQNTLRYANRAKNIQTKVRRNVFNVNRHVKDYLVKIDEQMAVINELKAQQKEAEKTLLAKMRKQTERRETVVRESMNRLRLAYENSSAERQERIGCMKGVRAHERRIGLVSAWIAAFDGVCHEHGDEEAMPGSLAAMRRTAHGILVELEKSRERLHEKLERCKWERAVDTALQHSISQLPTGDGIDEGGEADRLRREVDMLKCSFTRDAYGQVLDQDRAGDAATVQVLLTAQFDMLASLSSTRTMSESEAVAQAKSMIKRLMETGCAAASQVVRPDGPASAPEVFPPCRRGTPKRKKSASVNGKPIAVPVLGLAPVGQRAGVPSPIKSPRRRRTLTGRKNTSLSPVKKSPARRFVRWRDDENEAGTLADFEKTPNRYETPDPGSADKTVSATEADKAAIPQRPRATDSPSDTAALHRARPGRFTAGFLSKSRWPEARTNEGSGGPSSSLPVASDAEDGPGPLRCIPVSRASNSLSPPADRRLHDRTMTKPDENGRPGRAANTSDSESESSIDPRQLRSALRLVKRRDRSSLAGTAGHHVRRTSAASSHSAHRPSIGAHPGPLASSANGISRQRRCSAERRGSPPISCSPPAESGLRSLTPGQARRMNVGGSPREREKAGRERGRVGGKTRRITIGSAASLAAAVGGGKPKAGSALTWR